LSNRLDSSDNSIIEEKNTDITAIINDANSTKEFLEAFSEFLEAFDKEDTSNKPLLHYQELLMLL